jgi:hypothetical protein
MIKTARRYNIISNKCHISSWELKYDLSEFPDEDIVDNNGPSPLNDKQSGYFAILLV